MPTKTNDPRELPWDDQPKGADLVGRAAKAKLPVMRHGMTSHTIDVYTRMPEPMYEEEPCWDCAGAGCGTCNDTGLLYTDRAITLQVEADP